VQHGFKKQCSCETQLLHTVHDIAVTLNIKERELDAMVLDFSKALINSHINDCVKKLGHYGVSSTTLQWIEDFLCYHSQQVAVDGYCSVSLLVTSGICVGPTVVSVLH